MAILPGLEYSKLTSLLQSECDMNTSTFQGIVENGQIRLLSYAKLPENGTV
jgi:hypothetical protein